MLRPSQQARVDYVSSGHARCVSCLYQFFEGLDIKYIAALARASWVWARAGRATFLPREALVAFLGEVTQSQLLGPDEGWDSDDDALSEVA